MLQALESDRPGRRCDHNEQVNINHQVRTISPAISLEVWVLVNHILLFLYKLGMESSPISSSGAQGDDLQGGHVSFVSKFSQRYSLGLSRRSKVSFLPLYVTRG